VWNIDSATSQGGTRMTSESAKVWDGSLWCIAKASNTDDGQSIVALAAISLKYSRM